MQVLTYLKTLKNDFRTVIFETLFCRFGNYSYLCNAFGGYRATLRSVPRAYGSQVRASALVWGVFTLWHPLNFIIESALS